MTFITAFALTGCGADRMPVVELPPIDTSNPLLAEWDTPMQTPPFDSIRLEHYMPAFETAAAVMRAEIKGIVENTTRPTFRNTIEPLERAGMLVERTAGLFFNLLEADVTPEMQQVSLQVQPLLTELQSDLDLNAELFDRVQKVHRHPGKLNAVQKRLLDRTYERFVRGGANLPDAKKEQLRACDKQLGELLLHYGQNALGATNAFVLNLTDPASVKGLPAGVVEQMADLAAERGEKGWTVTLQAPSYVPFMTYSTDRAAREKLWRAYMSRGLDGEFDNRAIVRQIVNARLEKARLLGYDTYAAYEMQERMSESPERVNAFLKELLDATYASAKAEVKTIADYAKLDALMPWDFAYWSERYKEDFYDFNADALKPYFELERVKKGVFELAGKLYGLNFTPAKNVQVYHPDVTAYQVADSTGRQMAVLYLDFFPRASKRSGAWMTEFRLNSIDSEGVETRPLVSLVMNFTKPTRTMPSLLTFQELTTFLHEFGHALHGMLAEGVYGSMNGTNVYRDFVELPSQLMENFAVEREFLDMWAVHYQTGEKIPAELIEKVKAARRFQAAYMNVRQLSFGYADMAWHSLREPLSEDFDLEAFEIEALAPTQLMAIVPGTALSPAFSHIFSGGYAAGYYSYKWAEVLEADAFALFREKGIFNPAVSGAFRREVLSRGNQAPPMELYKAFRGHEPEVKALIEKMGL